MVYSYCLYYFVLCCSYIMFVTEKHDSNSLWFFAMACTMVYDSKAGDLSLLSKGAVAPFLDSVNGCLTENKIFNPFVRMHFLSVSHSANALLVRRGLFSPAESFYACMHKTWNGLHWKKAPAGCTVAVHWHAFCLELLRSLSCTCPVRIRWCPVDLIRGQTTTWHAAGQLEVLRTLTACSADDYW